MRLSELIAVPPSWNRIVSYLVKRIHPSPGCIHILRLNVASPSSLITLSTLLMTTICHQPVAASTINHKDLIEHYDQSIQKLESAVDTAIAHRTALIERMGTFAIDQKNIETATKKSDVKKPALQGELDQLKSDLLRLEALLKEKMSELQHQQELSTSLPKPGVLADALADKTALEHHRAIALWQYRIHLRKRKIEAISNKKSDLLEVIRTTSNRNDAARTSMQKLTQKQRSLDGSRRSLEDRYAQLSADIVSQQDRIQRMSIRRKALQDAPLSSLKFGKYQGLLPDPTKGSLYKSYADPKAEGLLKWEGILVKAPLGQEIEAIFDGVVVFADEIQGLGNVAIIDHGMDYMSLYGMAELLVVEQMQNVITGQVIGTVGESIGNGASALYFEIRHDAATVNPEDWLSMQSISSEITE